MKLGTIALLESRQSPFFYPLSLQQVEWEGSI